MTQRGRRSSASLAIVPIGQPQRPEPPTHLSKEAKAVWRETVGAMRHDWFGRETHPVLEAYCRHVCLARLIANAIPAEIGQDVVAFDRMSAMHCRESAMLAMLATRMRLTHQSSFDRKTVKRDEYIGPKPWEIGRP
jgi:phage terminase small subunit